jgi:type I restriction enzyme M protein
MAHLYESMLKEMRDSAGDSGEFYTPRPVIRFIVQMVQPKLGDTIFDPACGTGGFLVEAYELLKKQVKNNRDRDTLQYRTFRGVEKKPMPYLLGMMNLLLHEIDRPNLSRSNALIRPLNEIGDKDRVDIIVTNPPFGGEEEKGIQLNFPEATRCSETALLFLQLIMRSLKPALSKAEGKGGRCGMVVPNGTLFGDGVCARLKEQLLKDFNLHTIVRLPNGVFAPYTSIPTNLLFFDRTGPTKEIWYYEQPLPEGRKTYTKTQPLRFEEFADCIAWWGTASRSGRKENDRAWRVPAERVIENGFNLDIKNPNAKDDFEHLPPEQLAADISKKEQRIAEIMAGIQKELAEGAKT